MPYRLFRPEAAGRLPLVLYLHGSGGLGDDNLKPLSLGNICGTRAWLLPENQTRFPCYVVVPQTDRGWARYDASQQTEGRAKVLPGLGAGSATALEIIDALRREFSVDDRRIYVSGQSMGDAGTWNNISHRPLFCRRRNLLWKRFDRRWHGSIDTPVGNFHGDSDQAVAVSVSRDRIAARRKAGGRPLSTEDAGVDHNCWEWAFTEPALLKWVFSQHRD